MPDFGDGLQKEQQHAVGLVSGHTHTLFLLKRKLRNASIVNRNSAGERPKHQPHHHGRVTPTRYRRVNTGGVDLSPYTRSGAIIPSNNELGQARNSKATIRSVAPGERGLSVKAAELN